MHSAKRRVVVTGMAGISPLGNDWPSIREKLRSCTNAVRRIEAWDSIVGLRTRVGSPAQPFDLDPVKYNRKALRSMGRVGVLGVRATELALADAGLLNETEFLSSGEVGIAYGSCSGTPSAVAEDRKSVV